MQHGSGLFLEKMTNEWIVCANMHEKAENSLCKQKHTQYTREDLLGLEPSVNVFV